MTTTEKQYPTRLYQFLITFGQTIFNISSSSSEDASAMLRQKVEKEIIPAYRNLDIAIPWEAKLVHIHDLETFGKQVDMKPVTVMNFAVEPAPKEPFPEEPAKITDYTPMVAMLEANGYEVKKRPVLKIKVKEVSDTKSEEK